MIDLLNFDKLVDGSPGLGISLGYVIFFLLCVGIVWVIKECKRYDDE